MRPFRPPVLLGSVLLLAAACGGTSGGGQKPAPSSCIEGTGPEVLVSGTVRYERLPVGSQGLGPGLVTRPARYVDVEVREVGTGTCYGQAATDQAGAFLLAARPPAGSRLQVHAVSRTGVSPDLDVTVHDDLPPASDVHESGNLFRFASGAFVAGTSAPVDLVVPYNPGTTSRPSIGFAVLDVLVTCTARVLVAAGRMPPPCHAYTQLGNNGATGTSFYTPTANAITYLGGAAGNLDGSDTDYFDDAVIAHEYGHFLEFRMSHTLSRGGAHSGEALEPNFAWSEGQATGFGGLLRGDAAYVDTFGTGGGTLISTSVEDWPQTVRGIGGEETVAEVLWDLGDGHEGRPDLDGDAAAVDLGVLLGAFLSFDPDADAPYLGLLLDRVVGAGGIPVATLAAVLQAPEDQEIGYPLAGDDVWPYPLPVPGVVAGHVDSTGANPCRALAASRWYAFRVPSTRTLSFAVDVLPIPGAGSDLDVHLLGCSGAVIRSALTGDPLTIGPLALGPGCYIVRVEASCVGAGNRADFVLTVTEGP